MKAFLVPLLGLAALGSLGRIFLHRDIGHEQADDERIPAMTIRHADSRAPLRIGAASNFSQGSNDGVFRAALSLPLNNWRDSIRWADVEKAKGVYSFDTAMTRYPERLSAHHARLTLTLNWGNPLYDGGETPHSPQALAAFGRFVAEILRRYPAVDTLEIGNEINGDAFVSGPMKDSGPAQRRRYHLAMVRSAAAAARSIRPSVTVIGGSAHSLPAGFLWPLLDDPGAIDLNGLAVHPYTTPIDQLRKQFDVFRRHPSAASIPLYVTEFGSLDEKTAADELVRAYASLSSIGVTEFDWYPLNERGDGFVPLLRRSGERTDAGHAFQFVMTQLSAFRGQDLSPDPFTFLHAFGDDTWVLWGSPRRVSIDRQRVSAFSATGRHLDNESLYLDEARVLILKGKVPLRLGENVTLGCTPLIADSFYGFVYPSTKETVRSPGGFTAFAAPGDRDSALATFPGQQADGVPWTPYLSRGNGRFPRASADILVPGPEKTHGTVLLRYIVPAAALLKVQAEFHVSNRTEDGVDVKFSIDDRTVSDDRTAADLVIEREIAVKPRQVMTFALSAGTSARGDATKYRIRVYDRAACPKTDTTNRPTRN